ncbi:MAG: NusA-like transcription termination signal-binding factor [Candidatus Thermoplasmatota archaeon]|jgi:N utilization substance protein A|nr:NusA-like transcription termination signal-binding factor [Candidatus Thermoplasmatota archaeon]
MKDIVVDNKIMGYIAIFERIAHTELKECLENEDMIVFIVGEKKMAELFKRNPSFVSELKQKTNKHILVAEASHDLINFVRNIFFRLGVKEIQVNWKEGTTDVLVSVDPMEIGKAIGKEGRNIKLFRDTVQRFFNIRNLAIKQ